MPEAPPAPRVFFAIWPDAEVRQGLMRLALQVHRQVQGKPTRADSVHMTLLFLGSTPIERLELLAELASGVAFEAFTLDMGKVGCWKHNQVAWVAPRTTPLQLAHLVEQLERGATARGFPVESRPFAPHLTLVRKARCAGLDTGRGAELDAGPPRIRWDVREFVLVRSELGQDGSRYHPIGRWPAVSQPGRDV
jgi:2'-5' RNA ligase